MARKFEVHARKDHFMTDQKGGSVKVDCALIMAFSAQTTENVWYLDFAANVHITYDSSYFIMFIPELLPPL